MSEEKAVYKTKRDESEEMNVIERDRSDEQYWIVTPTRILRECSSANEYTLWCVIRNITGSTGSYQVHSKVLEEKSFLTEAELLQAINNLVGKGMLEATLLDDGVTWDLWITNPH